MDTNWPASRPLMSPFGIVCGVFGVFAGASLLTGVIVWGVSLFPPSKTAPAAAPEAQPKPRPLPQPPSRLMDAQALQADARTVANTYSWARPVKAETLEVTGVLGHEVTLSGDRFVCDVYATFTAISGDGQTRLRGILSRRHVLLELSGGPVWVMRGVSVEESHDVNGGR